MKTKEGLYALSLLPLTIAFSILLDAQFGAIRRRAAETALMAPRLWLQLILSAVFAMAIVGLFWLAVIRLKPGGTVYAIYLILGLLLSAYIPLHFNGFDLSLGLIPQEANTRLLSRGVNSFFILNSLFIASIGGLGILRLRRDSLP
jgi:hypothetical protein